ncbi:MAG: PepSY domain-containing protein, partial [Acidimicrobiia bacterium]
VLPSPALVLKIHRWLSLGALVWLLIISLTGVVLVFAPQIEEWSRPELYRATPGDKGPQAAVDAALAKFEGQDTAIDDIGMPADNRSVYLLSVQVTPPRDRGALAAGKIDEKVREPRQWAVYVDPGTGQVNGSRPEASGFIYWVQRGHYLLWQDDGFLWIDGDDLTGLVALATLLLTLSGAYIWYLPRVRNRLQTMRIRRKRGWFIFSLDLHRTLGLLVLIPLTVISFTGAAFAFPDMKLLWARLTPAKHEYTQHEPDEEFLSEEISGARVLTTDTVAELIRKRYPSLVLETLEPPTESDGVWGAWLTRGFSPWTRDGSGGNLYLQIDRFSHKILYAGKPEEGNVFDQAWDDWSLPLHGGDFLSNGSRSVWVLVGLSPLVLSVTGVVIWLRRRKRPSAARPRTAPRNGEMVRTRPIHPPHADCVDRLTRLFVTRATDQVRVRVCNPVSLGEASETEPDVSLVRQGRYSSGHPGADDTLLVVEVSDAGVPDRREKLAVYALAGIPEVWIVDPLDEVVEVYAGPQLSGWASSSRLRSGDSISLVAL